MAKRKSAKKPLRRKAKDTKAEKVETRTPGMGDNSQLALPAPDDYAHHMKTIRGFKDKLETAKSALSHAKTAANKACPGLAASINETLSIEREGDPAKLQQRLEMLGIGLKLTGNPIQLTIHDTLAGDQNDMVAKRGYEDGKSGRTPNNKYPEGSDLAALYSDNWKRGQAELLGVSQEQLKAAE